MLVCNFGFFISLLTLKGTGLESISETIKLTNEVAKLGADFALILTPSYYINAMTHEALVSYFTQVADNVTIPVLLYNVSALHQILTEILQVPAATNLNMQPRTVQELSKHPNIVGLKNRSASEILVFFSPLLFSFFSDFFFSDIFSVPLILQISQNMFT